MRKGYDRTANKAEFAAMLHEEELEDGDEDSGLVALMRTPPEDGEDAGPETHEESSPVREAPAAPPTPAAGRSNGPATVPGMEGLKRLVQCVCRALAWPGSAIRGSRGCGEREPRRRV